MFYLLSVHSTAILLMHDDLRVIDDKSSRQTGEGTGPLMTEYTLLLTAETDVHVNIDNVRQWFMGLKEHPEQYTFASHEGFFFTEGDFGEVGARFYTKERFSGLLAKLTFSLTEVTANSFTFELIKPLRNIKGQYALAQREQNITTVTLSVYARTKNIIRLFDIKPFSQAVKNQINREVQHIKTKIENSSNTSE